MPVPVRVPSRFSPSPTRRRFLEQAGGGLGALALHWLLHEGEVHAGDGCADSRRPAAAHFPAKARSVIYLFMHGGPSHLETFDPKPELQRSAGQPLPPSFGPVATRRKVAHNPLLATRRTFRKCGQSGIEISDFLPHLAGLCRRPGGDPLVLGRQRQSSPGRLRDQHRLDLDGQAEPGELGQLWPGHREPGPAGVPRPARSRRRDQGRAAGLRGGVLAGQPPGNLDARWRSPDPRPGAPEGTSPASSGGVLDLVGRLNDHHLEERGPRSPSWRRAFRRTSWRFGCRPRPPRPSICARSRPRRGGSTAG